MFGERLKSGILLVIIAVVTVVMGGEVLFATVIGISLIGMMELYRVYGIDKTLTGIVGYLFLLCYSMLIYIEADTKKLLDGGMTIIAGKAEHSDVTLLIILAFMLLMAVYVLSYPKYNVEQMMAAVFGMIYVAVMMSYIYQVRVLEGGAWFVWLIFISAWGCDTCAYCVGVLFGKHKMAPKLSPKKSIEGGIGGVVGAGIIGAIYGYFAQTHLPESISNPVLLFAVVCAAGGIISQIGDLTASAIKRNKDIKDYGHLIPGHGGILDRFDSIIFTAPIVYFLTIMLR